MNRRSDKNHIGWLFFQARYKVYTEANKRVFFALVQLYMYGVVCYNIKLNKNMFVVSNTIGLLACLGFTGTNMLM